MNYILDYEQPRCETCRWWMSDGSGNGECRRYPPNPPQFRPNANGYGLDWIIASWPDTEPKDFCGEHAPVPTSGPTVIDRILEPEKADA